MPCQFDRRARSLAEREQGCPLDHCGGCGEHVDRDDHTCPALAALAEHTRMLKELLIDEFCRRPHLRDELLVDIFVAGYMFATEGPGIWPSYNGCGQAACPQCSLSEEEDPLGPASRHE